MLKFISNGKETQIDVPPHWTLLRPLPERLGLTGTKEGRGTGECEAHRFPTSPCKDHLRNME
jgi:carbon-monoxide dehydrogenase small subunit